MTAPHKQVWTSPGEDPQLVGNETRTAWLMTRDNVGADLLSGGEGGGGGAAAVRLEDQNMSG